MLTYIHKCGHFPWLEQPDSQSALKIIRGYATTNPEQIRPGDIEPATWAFLERGRALTAADYLENVDALHRYARQLCAWWAEGNDLLVTPTMAEPAPPIGELKGAPVERIIRLVPYTAPYNVSGQPAIALPLYWTDDGLPVTHWISLSNEAATRNINGSCNAGANTCTPTGSPSAPTPYGTLIAGWPARLDGMVHTSDMYIANGLSAFSPALKAGVGVVGPITTSHSANA